MKYSVNLTFKLEYSTEIIELIFKKMILKIFISMNKLDWKRQLSKLNYYFRAWYNCQATINIVPNNW
jgi:hypothetical protein